MKTQLHTIIFWEISPFFAHQDTKAHCTSRVQCYFEKSKTPARASAMQSEKHISKQ